VPQEEPQINADETRNWPLVTSELNQQHTNGVHLQAYSTGVLLNKSSCRRQESTESRIIQERSVLYPRSSALLFAITAPGSMILYTPPYWVTM